MNPSTLIRPELSEKEWSLVIELLERERSNLPNEIHHTTTRSFREQLRERLHQIETLLSRLNPA